MTTAGLVLCGGRSSRMGRPKPWLPFGDELMLPRVVGVLAEAVAPIVVVAGLGQALPPLPKAIRVARDEQEGRGPLQGLAAGLKALSGQADAAFVSSCDVPFLKPAFVRRMIELLDGHDIAVPFVGGRPHPLSAVCRLDVLPAVERLLATGRLRLTDLVDNCTTRFVHAEELRDADRELSSLRNVNTPEEYERALREIAPTAGA